MTFDEQVAINERKFWRRLLDTCLHVQDLQPFALNETRGECESASDTKPGASSAQKELARNKLARLTRLFATYFCLKTILLGGVQFSLLSQRVGTRNRLHSSQNTSSNTPQRLAQLIGNPLEPLNDLSILCYISPSGYSFVCTVLLGFYYKRWHPIDNPTLRLLLDPRREFIRIDQSLGLIMDKLRASFDIYRAEHLSCLTAIRCRSSSCSLMGFSGKSSLAARLQLDRNQARESSFMGQMWALLAEFQSNLAPLRPANLTAEHYLKSCSLAAFIMPLLFGDFIIVGVAYGIPFLYLPYASRCPQFDCNPLEVYSVAELVLSLEIWITICICVLSATRNLSLLVLLLHSQMRLITAIDSELTVGKEILMESFNIERNQYSQLMRPASKSNHIGHNKAMDCLSRKLCASQLTERQRNRLILRMLIKLLACSQELKRNSRCLSMEVGEQFYYIFGMILVIVTHNLFGIQQTQFARLCIVLITWLEMNSITISCAYIHSRGVRFRRKLWPLLATALEIYNDSCRTDSDKQQKQNYRHQHHQQQQQQQQQAYWSTNMSRVRSCSFVINLLTKLVHSASFGLGDDCARVLHFRLNYRRIIQANFFVVFVYSFTMRIRF